ncbi:hypothetical protein ATANTOWER_021438 [Ataeniobius toweri]|uniref:Mos1 transposase HTH domain-containing protein n=1 Tax=Ataeniobius toweri TaxID=208326 RepID=A0ABU7CEF2_9TELE|nr:hypothetical protein [Ataeniobius toweri]
MRFGSFMVNVNMRYPFQNMFLYVFGNIVPQEDPIMSKFKTSDPSCHPKMRKYYVMLVMFNNNVESTKAHVYHKLEAAGRPVSLSTAKQFLHQQEQRAFQPREKLSKRQAIHLHLRE